jgi:DNA-3-methyladenine glycosylase II
MSRRARPSPDVALSAGEVERARRRLMRVDPRLAPLIRHVGPCRLADGRTHAPFASLVYAIVSQQLSGKAAATIHARVVALVGGVVTPESVLAVETTALRAAGLSGQKVAYVRDLAARVQDGRLDLERLETQDDESVIQAITEVKGLGRWSAEMFLMFRMNRPDIFPLTDLGIVKGMQRLLGMKRRPAPRTMLQAAERWRPYRSVAAWYLWRLLEANLELPRKAALNGAPARSGARQRAPRLRRNG